MGPWKGVRQNMLRKNATPLKIQLYNLDSDPNEKTDLASRHPDVVEQLRSIMTAEHTPSKIYPIPVIDN